MAKVSIIQAAKLAGISRTTLYEKYIKLGPGFLGGVKPIESIIRSSEKSNSPCRLKCAQVATEPLRTASSNAARRSSFFSSVST